MKLIKWLKRTLFILGTVILFFLGSVTRRFYADVLPRNLFYRVFFGKYIKASYQLGYIQSLISYLNPIVQSGDVLFVEYMDSDYIGGEYGCPPPHVKKRKITINNLTEVIGSFLSKKGVTALIYVPLNGRVTVFTR